MELSLDGSGEVLHEPVHLATHMVDKLHHIAETRRMRLELQVLAIQSERLGGEEGNMEGNACIPGSGGESVQCARPQ